MPRSRAWVVLVVGLLARSLPSLAAGGSPADAIPLSIPGLTGPWSLANSSAKLWFRLAVAPASSRTHFEIETTGTVDTLLRLYASRADAEADRPLASDDDLGTGLNALVRAPIGFVGPYYLRLGGYSGGSVGLTGRVDQQSPVRCDWPAGCSLSAAAEGEPGGATMLLVLRSVEEEILGQSARGRRLSQLYRRVSAELIPRLLGDAAVRRDLYARVVGLLPLADRSLRAVRGQAGAGTLGAEDVAKLSELLESLLPYLPGDTERLLREEWSDCALSSRVGLPLADVLRETGLLPRVARARVLFKVRGSVGVTKGRRTGVVAVDEALHASEDVSPLYSPDAAHQQAGLSSTFVAMVGTGRDPQDLLRRLQALPEVAWVEADGRFVRALGSADPYAAALWGLEVVHARQAWPASRGTCSSQVAVIDTGIRPDLTDFAGRLIAAKGYDFADDDSDPLDLFGHGTHVAATIVATADNAVSVAGVAPGACFFAVKVLADDGNGTLEDLADGIVYAVDQGAKVINMSLGCDCSSQAVDEALQYAADHDVVVVAAAGNDGAEGAIYPASSPLALGVGAVDAELKRASFSNWGSGVDLVGPGVDVVSLFRDGESCLGSGTSMATPHVAAVATLVRAQRPSLDRVDVISRLLSTARDLGAPGPDPYFGAGLVDAAAAVAPVAKPSVALAVVRGTARESPLSNAVLRLTRSGATGTALSVKLAWSGTAVRGVDYRRTPQSVTIAAGSNDALVRIVPIDDSLREPEETILVQIVPAAAYETGSPGEARLTLRSDETQEVSLTFPLAEKTPYRAIVSSVLDHHVATGYYHQDGVIAAYDGEEATGVEHCYNPPRCTIVGRERANGRSFELPLLNYEQGFPSGAKRRVLWYDGHSGYDYAAAWGDSILAASDGTLCIATDRESSSDGSIWRSPEHCPYGSDDTASSGDTWNKFHELYVTHGDSGYRSLYLHASSLSVEVATAVARDGFAMVRRGDVIGRVGNVGLGCEGHQCSHLHFEVRNGESLVVDPYELALWALAPPPSTGSQAVE